MNSIEEKVAETRILRRTAEESKKCYTCPDGYLESLADTIIDRIPSEQNNADVRPSPQLWVYLKPSLYLAASFLIMILSIKGLSLMQDKGQDARVGQKIESQEDDYANYYEDYATRLVGNEAEHNLDKACM